MLSNCLPHSSRLAVRTDSSPAQKVVGNDQDCSITGLSSKPRRPLASTELPTGVSDKQYRGPEQGIFIREALLRASDPINTPKNRRKLRMTAYRLATGVANKRYRGPEQAVPGSPTNTTGVPSKFYRGARQEVPGCPTSPF